MKIIFTLLNKVWQRMDYIVYPLQDKNKYVAWVEKEAWDILNSKGIMAVEKNLENMGFKRFHNSNSSYVFCSPCGNFVIKLAYANEGYKQFIELALKRQNNPYYPKIYKSICEGDDNFQITLMENLSPLYGHNTFAYNDLRFLTSFLNARTRNFLRMGKRTFNLKQCATDLDKLFKAEKMHGNLNTTSVMRRGMQLVITDPVYHSS